MMPTAYVADGCPHCARLLDDLARRRVKVVVVNLSKEPARVVEVTTATQERRLPILIDHERCSIGFAGASSTFAELGIRLPLRRER